MVSERAKKAGRALLKFSSYFRENRDAATVMFIGAFITFVISLSILYLSIQNGSFLKADNAIFEIMTDAIAPILEIVASVVMFRRVYLHRSMGGLGILMGIISLPGSEGGLLIGFILVVIGGVMSMLYREPYTGKDNNAKKMDK